MINMGYKDISKKLANGENLSTNDIMSAWQASYERAKERRCRLLNEALEYYRERNALRKKAAALEKELSAE